MMDRSDILLLTEAGRGDSEAMEKLIKMNSGLIWSIVHRYFGRGVDPDDLYQLGCVGFIKAVRGFDVSFGTQFSTYAVPKISGEIRRFLRDDGSIKVSRSIKEQAAVIKNARSAMEQKLGRQPSVSEISEDTGISVEDIAAAETATAAPKSLQSESGEDGFTLERILGDRYQEDSLIEYVSLHEAINTLPDTEKTVLKLLYYKGLTQMDAARIMNVSQVQISRLEHRAIDKLRSFLTS